MTRRPLLGPLPPFIVGVTAAGVAEISASLLLYSAEGFLPALTLILTVESGAMALGLWSGTVQAEASTVEQVRRRWLFGLVALALGALFATAMTLADGGLRGGLGQGFGLAFLGTLPLFALGALLGGMARSEVPSSGVLGVPVAAGLAVGFLLTGWLLIPNLAPYTLYLILLSLLSGGALLHGWALDGGPQVQILEERETSRGPVRVEDRFLGDERALRRVILEGDRVRAMENHDGTEGRPWEMAVRAAVQGDGEHPGSVLFLGGGGGTLARLLLSEFPGMRVVVVEESRDVVALARLHLHPFPGWGDVELINEEPWEGLGRVEGRFSLLLLDTASLPALGPVPAVPEGGWEALSGHLDPGGVVVLGELAPREDLGQAPLESLWSRGASHFGEGALYEREEEAFLLFAGPEARTWPSELAGFRRTPWNGAAGV